MTRRLAIWLAWIGCLMAWTSAQGATAAMTVVDGVTGLPIAGATVVSAGAERVTANDGTFMMPMDGPDGGIAMTVRAPGYARLETVANGTTPRAIALAPLRPKAVYLSVYGIADRTLREAAIALRGATAINALVIDMKGDRGLTPYPSAAREAIGVQAQIDHEAPRVPDLPASLRTLHARGFYLIARIVVFKDDPLAAAHPEWAVRDAEGNVWRDREDLRWIDPTLPPAWSHNLDLAEEAARMGFDEVQFDYLRFPDAPGLRFSETNTRARRVAAITGFLSAARDRLRHYNIYLSADIFGYVCWNLDDTAIGQQLETLGGLVDYISPMLYPSGFTWGLPGCRRPTEHPGEIVSRSLAEAKRRTGLAGVRFRPWLQAFRDYAFDHRDFEAEEIGEQVKAADAAGTDGWMLWNPRNRYDPATLPR
ncbi:putative glycoside hydrolase [Cupriavidus pinatubonensis]|uniref:putative glycoside hydrolase n=1 Tax=Cupriavidus pinatubonensis TaxID=248026 RepID=UPI001125D405|nr:GTP-binding protein [Cupriavidus pinatubonensis]